MTSDPDTPLRRPGRPRDPARDGVILDATLEVLAELGWDGMTVDLVAARAGAARATVYRRWPSKLDLVRAALEHLGPEALDEDALPDTGTLRGDLLATSRLGGGDDTGLRVRVLARLQAASEPAIAPLLAASGVGGWIRLNRTLIRRSLRRRGRLPAGVDAVAEVLPLMCAARVALQQQPITREFVVGVIDHVLLPAVDRLASPTEGAHR